jgi:hypothetical protein
MSTREKLTIAALAAVLAVLIVPAFAQDHNGLRRTPDQGMRMDHMGQGTMGGGMMSGGMMRGCSEMMQSMNNGGDGRPNNQWQKRPPGSSDNGG